MKKFGLLVFIVAILVGVVFANLFSFGRVSGKIFSFSFGSSIRGSGVESTQSRNAVGFTGVDVGGVFQVEVRAGKDFAVEVTADDNLLQYIKTEVHDGVLKISTTEGIKSHEPMRVRVSAPNIENLEASGASKVNLSGVNNSNLKIDTSGASKINISGETKSLNIEVSGASFVEAGELKSQIANVDASGASKVNLFVTERLESDASGASKISYAGNPGTLQKSSSGASKIAQR